MSAVQGKSRAYGNACRLYAEADAKVNHLRKEMDIAEEELKRASMLRNQTQRELLEEAKQT